MDVDAVDTGNIVYGVNEESCYESVSVTKAGCDVVDVVVCCQIHGEGSAAE